ncbi:MULTISPECIES: hypothetical protein [unclassified Tolypothrix]|uniref:Uncharacterized protein n=1 Tax=Microchaete diplosiphon TaxID=1197 RepID=Q6GZZ0_MICDP|nr:MULTISPECIES: hypothetical protein [unclassified Tolypothrix]AAT41979.1 hypothetical protein [Fremyella diplosiphon Fd33]BAY89655.1 hypothetical protein NIES3275_16580 [Microchaete diplosiphon NIES-3275]EKE97650.1 hypothetical protein FDUTEX481_05028 [Tolypothrix sp. PCC 7601]MBE9083225.1 hypothetical protein [Tolypothrix sp. LEGE 11397]UYD23925.1 hypothetical protein HGR01_20710 [Tolypothrix sp. PCC 7712]
MAEPTLQQVFGAGATQDATSITILKADLVSTGFTSATSNRAEQIFVAILLKADDYLNETNQGTDNDIQVTIADSGYPSIVTRNNAQYRQTTYNVNLQKADSGSTVDPNDY